jgi:hypothetical protein
MRTQFRRSAGLALVLALLLVGTVPAAAQTGAELAIQDVIQRSNATQVQALATRNPRLLGDTAEGTFAQQMIRTNQGLLNSDVSSIDLVNIEWVGISVSDSRATAATYETWRTSFASGPTQFARDRNVYELLQDSSGAWKIIGNDHPDGRNRGAPSVPPASPPPPQPEVQPSPSTSRNWSGYAARGGNFTSVSATWTIPTLALDGTFGADATWVGIGGLRSRDLIQAGTQQLVSGAGSVTYQAWIETLPDVSHPVPLTVLPGDSVTVSVDQQAGDTWLISFLNASSGQTLERTLKYPSRLSSAEWIEEAPFAQRSVLPISQFGSLTFTDASATKDGQLLSIAELRAQPISLVDDAGRVLAFPSPLASDGAGFTVSRN